VNNEDENPVAFKESMKIEVLFGYFIHLVPVVFELTIRKLKTVSPLLWY